MEVTGGAISSEAKYDVKIEDGKIKVTASYDGKGLDGAVTVAVEIGYFLDKVKEAVPGKIDDVLIDTIKAALAA